MSIFALKKGVIDLKPAASLSRNNVNSLKYNT